MNLSADYLIVGSGAMGMAFADVLVEESDATLIIVDKNAAPGGHWNFAYPFVQLHQPAAFYGVSSKELSNGTTDQHGFNEGFASLSSLPEIQQYYKAVMEEQFLPSGRVQYFPQCEYMGEHQFRSLETGEVFHVDVAKKLVNATYLNTSVPSTHTPNFSWNKGTSLRPINDLPDLYQNHNHFCIIGGGKTGMDAIIYLLQNNVSANAISWVISRDSWVIDRATTQNTADFFLQSIGNQAHQFEALTEASSIDDLFLRLEEKGVLMRLDKNIVPNQFHGATVSKKEWAALQTVGTIIRKGRVKRINENTLFFDQAEHHCPDNTLFVDCSATPIRKDLKSVPIFQDKHITLQTVRSYQPAFSAAFAAHVELNYPNDKEKNKRAGVVPLPDRDTDWLRGLAATTTNQLTWSSDKPLRQWMTQNRLDGFSHLVRGIAKDDLPKQKIIQRLKTNGLPAMMKLQQFIQVLDQMEQKKVNNPLFQVEKKLFFKHELVASPALKGTTGEGQILVKIDRFAYTANNITYAATGDVIRYWEFFQALGDQKDQMGVIPVWGFADVVESNCKDVPVGDRIYGYFPPTAFLMMHPQKVQKERFFEGAPHRQSLPMGYNLYRRVNNEAQYNPRYDNDRALLFPLFLTSFCLWDSLQEQDWFGAAQVLVLSASSKTSIGLGYALQRDPLAPKSLGVTSEKNQSATQSLGIWDEVITYDQIEQLDATIPTVIVDMSGNNAVLQLLHQHFGDQMKFTLKVGLTHWSKANPNVGTNNQRSKFFFAPAHIEKRFKEWGPARFDEKVNGFFMETVQKTKDWLEYNEMEGLEALAKVHPEVCNGTRSPKEGIIIKL